MRSAESSRSWIVKARSRPIAWRVFAQQPRADRVKGAGPGERAGHAGAVAQRVRGDALDAARHLGGGAAREGQQQDAARIGAVDDQMRDAVRQRVGLAGAGARR